MAKEKLDKKGTKSKRKRGKSIESPEAGEEKVQVKTKRKRVKVEDPSSTIPSVGNTEDQATCESKKRKKKRVKEQKCSKQNEIPDESSCPDSSEKPEEETDLNPDEKKVLERKIKKILKKEEKKRLKADGQTAQKLEVIGPSASQQAMEYLACWAEKRSAWKFQKTRQTWLLQHMFDSEKIPDEKFSVLLQYVEGLRGMARDTTVEKALSLVEESGRAPEDTDVQQRALRARGVIQLLS